MELQIKQEVQQRLQTGNLLQLDELRGLLKQVLLLVVDKAKRDFEDLMALDQHLLQIAPDNFDPNSPLPPRTDTTTLHSFRFKAKPQTMSFSMGHQPCALQKMNQVIVDLHLAVVKLLELTDAQHKERVGVIKAIVKSMEEANLLKF